MSFLPVRRIGASKCRSMPSESLVRLVLHDPYLDIEILLPPRINKTAPTFIGTVPCRFMEKDFDLIVIHDDFLHEIVNEHLCLHSQGLLVVCADLFFGYPNRVLALLHDR